MRRGRYAPGCVSARINAGPLCLDVLRCQNFPACYSRATFMKRAFHTFAIYAADSPSATANLPVTIARVLPPVWSLHTPVVSINVPSDNNPRKIRPRVQHVRVSCAPCVIQSYIRDTRLHFPLRVLLIALTRVYIELLPVVPAAGLSWDRAIILLVAVLTGDRSTSRVTVR